MSPLPQLADKNFLVTGAASGIGLAVATRAAALGAVVQALDIAAADSAGAAQLQALPNLTYRQLRR